MWREWVMTRWHFLQECSAPVLPKPAATTQCQTIDVSQRLLSSDEFVTTCLTSSSPSTVEDDISTGCIADADPPWCHEADDVRLQCDQPNADHRPSRFGRWLHLLAYRPTPAIHATEGMSLKMAASCSSHWCCRPISYESRTKDHRTKDHQDGVSLEKS